MASSSDDEFEAPPPVPTRRRSSRQLDDDDGSYRLRKRATNLAPITHTKPSKNAPAVTEEELERLGHAPDARLFTVLTMSAAALTAAIGRFDDVVASVTAMFLRKTLVTLVCALRALVMV